MLINTLTPTAPSESAPPCPVVEFEVVLAVGTFFVFTTQPGVGSKDDGAEVGDAGGDTLTILGDNIDNDDYVDDYDYDDNS